MLISSRLKVKELSAEIHLAGPGFGEGVLIVIGQKIVIGIDCCISLAQGKTDKPSYLDKKINELGNNLILFWILTHYHYDHFQKLDSVLQKYSGKLKSIIIPNDYTEADIIHVVQDAKDSTGDDADYHLASTGYKKLRNILSSSKLNYKIGGGSGSHEWFKTSLISDSGSRAPLEVHYFGPPQGSLNKLLGQAASRIPTGGKGKTSRSTANQGSYILYLKLGKFQALFLGDSEANRFEQLQHWLDGNSIEVSCIKVAHHGSEDGTVKELLELCGKAKGRKEIKYALIAPFKRHNLPSESVLKMLSSHGFTVKISGSDGMDKRVESEIIEDFSTIGDFTASSAMAEGGDIITTFFSL